MRVLLLLSLLLVGCTSPVAPTAAVASLTASPPVESSTPTGTPSPSATPTLTPSPTVTSALSSGEECRAWWAQNKNVGPATLSVSPPDPRAGEVVRVTGRVIASGAPRIVGMRLLRQFHGGIAVGSANVAGDGTVVAEFAAPLSEGCFAVTIGEAYGPGMVIRPTALEPARCDSLPNTALYEGDFEVVPLEVTPATPRIGEPVTLSGKFPTSFFQAGPATAIASLHFGRDSSGPINGTGSITGLGAIEFTFLPTTHPEWSGKCVSVVVGVSGHPSYGWARFDWP